MSCGTSISMPSTMARKSSRLRPKRLHRGGVILQSRRRMALIQRVDIVAPLLQRGQPLGPRAVGIGDVVDLPAEAVDLEHRLALRARQDAHRRVERTAGRGGPVICVGRRRLNVMRRPPVLTRAGVPPRGERFRRRCRRRCRPSNSSGLRCTRSLRGSRTFSMPTILSAKAWITATSSPSRKSFTSALSDLLSSSSASVRTASACRHCSSAGDDFASSELSTGGARGGQRIARQIDAVEVADNPCRNPADGC